MEKELNIAAILKDKPVNTHLYDVARNVTLLFQKIDERENITCSLIDGLILKYTNTGSMSQYPTGMEVLKPSKGMQEWSKFAWKKGDVLRFSDILVVFEKWTKDDYTEFKASYEYNCHSDSFDKGNVYYTSEFCKAIDEVANNFIKKIEETYGGKLNLETLQIEQPKQEFKDGDIVFAKGETKDSDSIGIVMNAGNGLNYHYWANYFYRTDVLIVAESYDDYVVGHSRDEEVRKANNSEKQQLFSALAKEGKVWNPDTKQIEELPKKCEFKPMDLCLMRQYHSIWSLCQYAFKNDRYSSPYFAIGGNAYNECIPYNDQTAHLLGTTDEWKGGEG